MKNLIFLFLFAFGYSYSQEGDAYVKKDFLILMSTKYLDEAYKFARSVAAKTGFMFRDMKLTMDSLNGVTFPRDSCTAFGFEFPCYLARGRWDDGGYISIEYSDAYQGFTKGYFIVMAASGYKDQEEYSNAYKHVKKLYPKSYAKRTSVYMGCMH